MGSGLSEDAKGDPTKELPHQPIPDRREREGIEPLIPPQDGKGATGGSGLPGGETHKTEGDRKGGESEDES